MKRLTSIALILALIVVVAAAIYIYHYLQIVHKDNAIALNMLNDKILLYDGNIRYMLKNKSTYESAFAFNKTYIQMYPVLLNLTNPYANMSLALSINNFSDSNSIAFAGLLQNLSKPDAYSNMYAYNPQYRNEELYALYGIGFFTAANITPVYMHNKVILINQSAMALLGINEKAPLIQTEYELKYAGDDILFIAYSLSNLFNQGFFNSSKSDAISQYNIGLATVLINGPGSAAISETSALSGNYYDMSSIAQISNGWISLMGDDGSAAMYLKNTTAMRKMLYVTSLSQYIGYGWSEMFYNKSISPNIELMYYFNGTTFLNLGNLNPANSNVSIYIDGNDARYIRYYNNFLIYNKSLNIGYHNISVVINNTPMHALLYVSAIIPTSFYVNGQEGVLSFRLVNNKNSSLTVSNISIACGISPAPKIAPGAMARLIYDENATLINGCGSMRLANATYSRFNGYANYTTYNLNISPSYVINRNDYVTLYYDVSRSSLNALQIYTVKMDTNHGMASGIIIARSM